MKIRILILSVILFLSIRTYSQFLPSLALAGGPSAGWFFNDTKDLNAELKRAGFPELSNGFFTLGGNGFIDIPLKKETNFLRIGGLGLGYSSNKDIKVNDSLTKAVTYNFGMGGMSFEFVKTFGSFDIFFGSMFTTGTLKIDLYQYGKNHGNWNSIFGQFESDSTSSDITRNFKSRFYGVQPQAGFAVLLKKFFYLKVNAGYLFSFGRTWKVDNDIEVTNFPAGIKPDGFNINLSVNVGIFFRD